MGDGGGDKAQVRWKNGGADKEGPDRVVVMDDELE